MKAQLLRRSIPENCSFSIECHSYNNFLKVWHYHPELELVFILESTGTRFVGDSIEKFEAGEIVLIGKNLPHLWLNDKEYFDKSSRLKVKAIVIHFMESFSESLLQIPEMAAISELFQRASYGIKFEGVGKELMLQKANELFDLHGLEKMLKLLELLKDLSQHQTCQTLSSNSFMDSFQQINNSKMLKVYGHIMHNFKKEISLEATADLVHMNPSAFSRYFKQLQKKSFTRFVNEVRVGYACKLLMEQKYNVAEVCYESGFKNLSNFNRQFKALKNMPPSAYIKMHAGIVRKGV